ncbi:MAG: Na/Pi symporter [Gemmatimonadaceae bacterium]|jgi:phosphate:Na+ symporter|nr:Na/Pi symporter [Gemmatimonadaceae bacterium]
MQIALGMLAGVALFLYGISVMSDALKALAGERARAALGRATDGTWRSILIGAVATAALGSSSLSIIMTIALVDAGLLSLPSAMAVILGANIGTTLASQLFAFNAQQWGPLVLVVGLVASVAGRHERQQQWGRVLLGVGLLFYGLHELDAAARPLGQLPTIATWLRQLTDPPMGALVGAGVTVLVQASSATVALAITFVREGLLSLPAGIAVMLGAEIGTCSDTLIATLGRSRDAIRTGVFHLVFNVTTVLVALPLVGQFATAVQALVPMAGPARDLANAHILFNTAGVLLAAPFVPFAAAALRRLIPDRPYVAPRVTAPSPSIATG